MPSPDETPRCSARVWGARQFSSTRCPHRGKVQVGEEWYCGVHDPEKKRRRDEKRRKRWAVEDALAKAKREVHSARSALVDYVLSKEKVDEIKLPALDLLREKCRIARGQLDEAVEALKEYS